MGLTKPMPLTERIERRLIEEEPRPGIKLETHAMNLICTELVRLLGPAREIKPHNETVLMVGLYGQGKTTTTAKVAEWWRRKHGVKVAVIEADVHRPGAYAQLQQLLYVLILPLINIQSWNTFNISEK